MLGDADYQSNSDSETESDVVKTASILLEIRKDVKSLTSKFDGLSKSGNQLKGWKTKAEWTKCEITNKVSTLTEKRQSVDTTLSNHVKKQENLETYGKKNNLKFYDIDESRNETLEESLGIDTTD